MTFKNIIYDKNDSIVRIYLNNPETKNSMTNAMGEELRKAVEEIKNDASVRVVILSGKGNIFSSGGDFDMILSQTKEPSSTSKQFMENYYMNYFSIFNLPVPVIAMINGHAIGAGLGITLACDIRIIAESAKVGLTFVRIGLNVGMGGTYMLPRIIGWSRAAELLFTGKVISAEEAYKIGLANHIYPIDKLETETMALANQIANSAPLAVKETKKSLIVSREGSLEDVFQAEASGQGICYLSKDILEGVDATKNKRKAMFKGE